MASMREILSSVSFGTDLRMQEDNDILNGAQLSEKCIFKNKRGGKLAVVPLIVDLRRLLHCKSSMEVVPGISNRELLHAVVALYDVSLNEMTPDVLYATVCEKCARTMILLRDVKDLMEEKKCSPKKKSTDELQQGSDAKDEDSTAKSESIQSSGGLINHNVGVTGEHMADDTGPVVRAASPSDVDVSTEGQSEDVFVPRDDLPNFFAEVFSDSEADEVEEDSEEMDDDEDFSRGVQSFLTSVAERKRARRDGSISTDQLGIESRIVAAATFEKTYCKSNEKVVQLTLLAVRKRYRNWGVGRYLVSQIKKSSVSGPYDVIVVYADASATEFFQNNGFSDDVVFNTKWSDLTERFVNCTLMSYLPGFSDYSPWNSSIPELDISRMEREIAKWRDRSAEAYRAEICCMRRLRQEVIRLRAHASAQQQLLDSLTASHSELCQQKFLVEKQFLEYKLLVASAALTTASDDEDEINTEELLQQLQNSSEATCGPANTQLAQSEGDVESRFLLSRGSYPELEPYEHGRDTEDFYRVTCEFNEADDDDTTHRHSVSTVSKALLPPKVISNYQTKLMSLKEPDAVERLYFCGTLDDSQRATAILKEGFSDDDFTETGYGRGLYFCKRPSDAAQYSAQGYLLVADVGVGKVAEASYKDAARSTAGLDADSLSVTCRTDGCGDTAGGRCDREGQIIVFDPTQVLPLYLIHYATAPKQLSETP